MTTIRISAMLLASAMLVGCASPRGVPPEGTATACNANEALVCRNQVASRLDTRMNDDRHCTCESRLDGHD